MAYEIDYRFEDLPLIADHQGSHAGFVHGRAIVSIGAGRDWSIDTIFLDGSPDEVEVSNLPGTSEGAIYNIIFSALTSGRHEDAIQEHVNEWLAGASSRRADYRMAVA